MISFGVSGYGYDARVGYKFKIFSNVFASEVDVKNMDPLAFVDVDVSPLYHKLMKVTPKTMRDRIHYVCENPGCYLDCTAEEAPKHAEETCSIWKHEDNFIRIPPNGFALAETIEEFEIPRDVLAICVGKSTYARAGIIVNVTPLEPEWKGKVTVEISNTSPCPARIYAGEGIMQVIFLQTAGELRALKAVLAEHFSVDHKLYPDMVATQIGHFWSQHFQASCVKSYADKKGRYQSQEGLTLPSVD